MKVVIDIECNALHNPSQIWVVVCKNIDDNSYHIFREVTKDVEENRRLLDFLEGVDLCIGHNILGYDIPVIEALTGYKGFTVQPDIPLRVLDTLIISKLVDYPRAGHSIEHYGLEFGLEKGKYSD